MKKSRLPTIAIAGDHAAIDLKKTLADYLRQRGHEVKDMGPKVRKSVNYPDFGKKVAKAVAGGEYDLGVLICGTGIGMSMTANRFRGVRAALVHDSFTARMAREHNDANVLVFGARVIGDAVAVDALESWLSSRFKGGRHKERIDMLDE